MKTLAPNKPQNASETAAGFSLLELVVVMSIIAILTVAVMPSFQASHRDMKFESAIDDFIGAMHYAQSSAVSEAREYRLYFREDLNVYWIARREVNDKGEWTFVPVQDAYSDYTELPRGLEFAKSKVRKDRSIKNSFYVAFYPSGARDEARINIAKDGTRRDYEISTEGALSGLEVFRP